MLLEAFAGLKQQESTRPEAKSRATEAVQRLVQFYDGWNKKDKATERRQKLDEQKKKESKVKSQKSGIGVELVCHRLSPLQERQK
jgi:predicted ATPase